METSGYQTKLDGLLLEIADIRQHIVDVLISAFPHAVSGKEVSLRKYRTKGKVKENCGAVYFYKVHAFSIEYSPKKEKFKIAFSPAYQDLLPPSVKLEEAKSTNAVRIEIASAEELHALDKIIIKIFENAATKDIGCCSRYLECSDARHCVNPSSDISLHCAYRQNLNKGLIFYGENKNG